MSTERKLHYSPAAWDWTACGRDLYQGGFLVDATACPEEVTCLTCLRLMRRDGR